VAKDVKQLEAEKQWMEEVEDIDSWRNSYLES